MPRRPSRSIGLAAFVRNVGMRLGVALLAAATSAATASASPGDLDLTFGTDGKATLAWPSGYSWAFAVAVAPGGEILVGGVDGGSFNGPWALARFDEDGVLDPTFGSGGVVTGPPTDSPFGIRAIVVQPDGKILALGIAPPPPGGTHYLYTLVRYDEDGTPDATFGDNGVIASDPDCQFFLPGLASM